MLKRLWSDHRNACLLTLALIVIGIIVSPWVLLAAILPVGWVLLMPKGAQTLQHPETIESSEEVESNDDNEKGSYDIEELSDEFKEALCNSLAVAGIEDVIGRDPSEVWTVLGEDQPSGYDNESDEHTDIIEKAGNLLSNELLESLAEGIDIFEEKINENRGYISFWELFLELDQTDDIDEFNEALYNILEEIS